MYSIEKFMVMAGIGHSAYNRWQWQQVGAVVLTTALLVLVTAMLASAFVISLFYIFYVYQLSNGMVPMLALLHTSMIALFFLTILILMIRQRLLLLRKCLHSRIGQAIDAFLRGFLE